MIFKSCYLLFIVNEIKKKISYIEMTLFMINILPKLKNFVIHFFSLYFSKIYINFLKMTLQNALMTIFSQYISTLFTPNICFVFIPFISQSKCCMLWQFDSFFCYIYSMGLVLLILFKF